MIETYRHISIEGDVRFLKHTRSALDLLAEKFPSGLEMVQKYIGRIRQSERSGMDVYNNPPTFNVGEPTAYYSLPWYASTMVHDATHSRDYHKYRCSEVPLNVLFGQEAELRCNKNQCRVLEAMEETYLSNYVRNLDGLHFHQEVTW